MYSSHKTDSLIRSIDNIVDYMVTEYGDVQVALDLLHSIEDAIEVIERFPKSGKKYDSLLQLKNDYRVKLLEHDYKLFYTIDEENQMIYLSHIFHEKQNIEEI